MTKLPYNLLGVTKAPGRDDSDTPKHLCISALPLPNYLSVKSLDPERLRKNDLRNERERAKRAEIAKHRPKAFNPVAEGWYNVQVLCKSFGVGMSTLNAIIRKIGKNPEICKKIRGHWYYSPEMFEKIRAEAPPFGSRSTYSLFHEVTWRGIHTVVKMLARIGISPAWSLEGINYYDPKAVQKFVDAYPESIYGHAKNHTRKEL